MTREHENEWAALVAEAKTRPGRWVYEIVGSFARDEAVPASAIRGAWRVDENGEIVGAFIPNSNYLPPGQALP
jgi:hypothetical protein